MRMFEGTLFSLGAARMMHENVRKISNGIMEHTVLEISLFPNMILSKIKKNNYMKIVYS